MLFKRKRIKRIRPHPQAANVNKIILGLAALGLLIAMAKHQPLAPIENASKIKESIVKAAPDLPEGLADYKNFIPPDPKSAP